MYNQVNEELIQNECSEQSVPSQGNPFLRQVDSAMWEARNTCIIKAERITAAMLNAWKLRDGIRQAIANMACPWDVGMVIVLGDGRGPMDRRVVTAILPGKTEEGEYYRVKTRVLKKGVVLGKKEVNLRLAPELKIQVLGMFPGNLPLREIDESVKEV